MDLLPKTDNRKSLAFLLLGVALLLIYWVGFRWFFVAHAELSEQLDGLQQSEARFLATVAERPRIQSQIDQLQRQEQNSAMFLSDDNFSLGAASLIRRLKQLISLHADEQTCQVVSNSNVQSREPERFERVTVKVRMRCGLEDTVSILYAIESAASPMMLLDDVSLYRQQVRRRNGAPEPAPVLDVRFDLIAYLRPSGGDA
ncbi:MAG: hypothetical protein DHS20C11_24060 [Lysobacteraceae bacterium]|nr:MAG: hypothetical protein DHS20C11_24060 [Xanthomonadaceae bacterium]